MCFVPCRLQRVKEGETPNNLPACLFPRFLLEEGLCTAKDNLMAFFRIFTLALVMLLAGSLLACATPPAAPAEDDPVAELEALVRLPERIRKLSITERIVHEPAEAGVQYRYAGDLVYHVDVFVYPVSEAQRRFLIESDKQALVASEYGAFRDELAYAVNQGWYDGATTLDERIDIWQHVFEVQDERLTVPFLVAQAQFNIERQGMPMASFVALSEFKGYFIKIRLTHPDYPGLSREMSNFTEQLFAGLYGNDVELPAITIGQGEDRTDVMCLPGESMLECLSRAIRTLLPPDDRKTESI